MINNNKDKDNDLFISNFINNCLLDMSVHTKRAYNYYLKRFCRWAVSEGLNISNITEQEVKKYIIYLISKKNSSGRQQIYIIARFMKFSTGKEFNIKDIINLVDVNKKHANLPSVENVKELVLSAIERAKKGNNLRDEALLNIFFGTGLRVGEVEDLKRTDLKENDLGTYLDVNVYKKGYRYINSTRRIPIKSDCAECIDNYIKLRNDSNGAMFLSKSGQKLSIRGIQDILKRYGVNGQLLRRNFIASLINKGVNAAEVASLMGHKSAEIELKYFDLNKDYEHSAFKTLSELYNKAK